MKTITSFLMLYVLYTNIQSGAPQNSTSKCYNCAGPRNADCANNPKKWQIMNCPIVTPLCSTLVTNVTIQRSCGIETLCDTVKNTPGFVSCETCNTHLCNNQTVTGAGFVSSLSMGLAASTLLIISLL
nr:uncharacterized protein LOC111511238 [Leptinotarsa decemlineata]